jgi:alpha-tubulin suppressor-like RCC1 family protein
MVTGSSLPENMRTGITAAAACEFGVLAVKNGNVLQWDVAGTGLPSPSNCSGIVEVACGGDTRIAIRADGALCVWGWSPVASAPVPAGLGSSSPLPPLTPPTPLPGYLSAHAPERPGYMNAPPEAQRGDVVAVSANSFHALALTRGGAVIGWSGDHGGWGQFNVPAEAQSGITAVSAGVYFSLALTGGGAVVQFGNYEMPPPPTEATSGIVAIAAGEWHGLALTEGGAVISWGSQRSGDYGQTSVPAEASSGVVAIAAGAGFSLALTSGGRVLAWGSPVGGRMALPAGVGAGIVAISARCARAAAAASAAAAAAAASAAAAAVWPAACL